MIKGKVREKISGVETDIMVRGKVVMEAVEKVKVSAALTSWT